MTMMLAPDLLDRRALALIALRDAFGRPVTSPVTVSAAGVRTVVKNGGTFAVVDAPGFAAHSSAFAVPPASPAIGSVSIPLAILPADPRLQARRYVLKLPRDPDPAKRGQANSLFAPVAVELLATPLQRREALAAIVRARVHRKSDGALVGGALVRIRSNDGKFEAMGKMSADARAHEEFRMQLEAALKQALASLDAGKEVSRENAEVLATALQNANIELIGGDGGVFDALTKGVSIGKALDGITGQSQVLQQLLGKLAGLAPATLPAPDDAAA